MRSFLRNPIGRKLITGVTGLGLTVFVIEHVSGNLIFFQSYTDYNEYAHFLLSLGPLLYILEAGLVAFFLFHIILGINIYLNKRAARSVGYTRYESSGKPSRQNSSSRTMIFTGIVLLVFLVIHLKTFKFGPGIEEGYVQIVDGVEMRDFSRLLIEKFQHPLYAFGYTAVMLLLAVHLRHGFWSAFQSLGATNPKLTPYIYGIGVVLGLLIAIGFLVLPLYIYFGGAQ